MNHIKKHYINPKSILRKSKMVDACFFPGRYGFSPYKACEHSCKYCDGRAEKYYVGGDFEKDIVIRKNLPSLLEKELKKVREKGIISIGSGISDPYQPVEKEEKIMKKAAEIIAGENLPASVMTKSSLIMRDIDIWEKVNKNKGFILTMSLTFTDDKLREIFEPGASTVEERIETLREFKKRGMFTGILAMPFIPYISDKKENFLNLAEIAKEIDLDFLIPASLTLRPGRQKAIFWETVKEYFPELLKPIEILYREGRQSGNSILPYRKKLHKTLRKAFHFIPDLVPHYVYKNLVPLYDEIYILLSHMVYLYSRKHVNVNPLKKALNKYTWWLSEEKKVYGRKRSKSYSDLEEKLISLIEMGELENIIENSKLNNFIRKVTLDRMTFDYITLKSSF